MFPSVEPSSFYILYIVIYLTYADTSLAQSVERQPFKLVVVGSSPTVGDVRFFRRYVYAPTLVFQNRVCMAVCPSG